MGESALTYEALTTLLAQTEGIIKSRPLTPLCPMKTLISLRKQIVEVSAHPAAFSTVLENVKQTVLGLSTKADSVGCHSYIINKLPHIRRVNTHFYYLLKRR